jgi:hypothetical protein
MARAENRTNKEEVRKFKGDGRGGGWERWVEGKGAGAENRCENGEKFFFCWTST